MILVTGGTGTIGRALLRRLSEEGIPARALSRSPERGEDLPGITWLEGDLARPESLRLVFADITKLFLLTSAGERMVELQRNAVGAAREAGVEYVVKLSALGASPRSKSVIGQWHYDVEQGIIGSGLAWTMLRPHVFMQNLLDQKKRIWEEGELRASSGEGMIPFIDARDIADTAFEVLTGEGHVGGKYVLTGGEALTYGQVAAILAAALDREVRYVDEPDGIARERMASEGFAEWEIEGYLALAAYQRAGGPTAHITRTVYELTGHAPRSMVQFAYDYAEAFRA